MHTTRGRVRVVVALTAAVSLLVACSGGGSDDASDGDDDARTTTTTAASSSTTSTTAEPATSEAADALKLNQVQVVGTHNSFHEAAPPEELALLRALDPEQAAERTYTHPPLTEQFEDQQIRQIELDVFADASGGLYASPSLRRQAGLPDLLGEVPELGEPGTKVLHEQDVDYHSVCPTLVDCLTELRDWSDTDPDHVPVAVNIQFKDGPLIFAVPDQAVPEKWTADAMEAMDEEIRSVFGREQLITPDDVRGDAATLEEAVLAGGWPTIGESRGKVLFLVVNGDPYRTTYLSLHPGLEGALLFTNGEPGQPDASFVNVDDPVAGAAEIADLAAKGYLVRTRADEPNVQGRTGDTARRDAALASGAHWVSTDYPGPDGATAAYGTDYVVALPGGVAVRCNPVTAPADCDDAGLE